MKDTVGLQVNVDGSMKLFLSTYRMGVWGYGRVLVWGGFMGGVEYSFVHARTQV